MSVKGAKSESIDELMLEGKINLSDPSSQPTKVTHCREQAYPNFAATYIKR
jgi:hypothetical protein